MLEFLQRQLHGRANGLEVEMRLLAPDARNFDAAITFADDVGVVAVAENTTALYPWSAIRRIALREVGR